jgi:hypothetical protein
MDSVITLMKNTIKNLDKYIRFFIWILGIVLVIATGFFVSDIREVQHTGIPHPRNPLKIIASGSHIVSGEVGVRGVEDIETWMTFAYINFTFGIPDSVLRDALKIDAPKYPQLSLRSYIKTKKLNSQIFLSSVKETVQSYLLTHPHP